MSYCVLLSSSDDSSFSGKKEKNKNAVKTLKNTITKKFNVDFFKVSISFIAIAKPKPSIGPINGEISIAPITTGMEFAFKPTDATKIEQINIQAVAPCIEISDLIDEIVESLSVCDLKSKIFLKKINEDLRKLTSLFEGILSNLLISSSSEKLNFDSII